MLYSQNCFKKRKIATIIKKSLGDNGDFCIISKPTSTVIKILLIQQSGLLVFMVPWC